MAERAAELDSSEFDVVFSAAHMLRLAKPLMYNNRALEKACRKLNRLMYISRDVGVFGVRRCAALPSVGLFCTAAI